MGLFGDGNKELEAAMELAKLRSENEFLLRENADLRKDKDRLQAKVEQQMDTIIAIQHPESFRALQDDRAIEGGQELSKEEKEILQAEQQAWRAFAHEQEQPLFKNADDFLSLMDKFGSSQGSPNQEGTSVHDNTES
jgi:hypothetical protein